VSKVSLRKLKVVALLAGVAFSLPARAQEPGIDEAKQLFAQFVALENAYDPALADLYADEALIKTRRSMPMGDPQVITVPAAKYKSLLRQNMPMAQARGERSAYENVTYTPEGGFVRIDGTGQEGEPHQSPGRTLSRRQVAHLRGAVAVEAVMGVRSSRPIGVLVESRRVAKLPCSTKGRFAHRREIAARRS